MEIGANLLRSGKADLNNVLFVTEKFCDAKPELGWTNSFHNLFATFSKTQPDYKFNTLHLDEAALIFGRNIDKVLLEYCDKFKVDIFIFCLLGDSPLNPTKATLQALKDKGKYVCVIWPDTGPGWGMKTIQELGDAVNLNVSIDFPIGHHVDHTKLHRNHLFLWTPEDDSLYYPQENKDIDISFVGTKNYIDRSAFLNRLKSDFPNMYIGGGQREEKLSPEQYASIIRRSKIGINFSLSATLAFYQLKGRTLEHLASKTLLIENLNPSTEHFFKNGYDYVAFNSYDELVNKIKYYLSNPIELNKIAEHGYKTFQEKCTAKLFWDSVMLRIEVYRKQKHD